MEGGFVGALVGSWVKSVGESVPVGSGVVMVGDAVVAEGDKLGSGVNEVGTLVGEFAGAFVGGRAI